MGKPVQAACRAKAEAVGKQAYKLTKAFSRQTLLMLVWHKLKQSLKPRHLLPPRQAAQALWQCRLLLLCWLGSSGSKLVPFFESVATMYHSDSMHHSLEDRSKETNRAQNLPCSQLPWCQGTPRC